MSRHNKERNTALLDSWSLVHLFIGILLGWAMDPFIALVIMTLWEPFEVFILSPILSHFKITFGYESLQNSLSDILFNVLGVSIGAFALSAIFDPPFHIF